MSDYKTILDKIIENYACRKRTEDIEGYFANRMQKDLHIKYLKPVVKERPAFVSRPHPLGGAMKNWSLNPDADELDLDDLAQTVHDNNRYKSTVQLTTYPWLGTRQYLDPLNYSYLKPMVKGHEYRHYLSSSLLFNLVYIKGLKEYAKAKQANKPLSKSELKQLMKDWLNHERFDGFSRADEIKGHTDEYNQLLDDYESENNINYECTDFVEENLLDRYKGYIDEMDFD